MHFRCEYMRSMREAKDFETKKAVIPQNVIAERIDFVSGPEE